MKTFLNKFEILRKKAIDEIIEKFNDNVYIEYAQPISIVLTYGYSAVLSKVLQEIAIKEGYLFCWDKIPEKGSGRFIEFLTYNYKANWIKKEQINKSNDKTINLSDGSNSLSLVLDKAKMKVTLIINNKKKAEFIVKRENDKLNIYKSSKAKELYIKLIKGGSKTGWKKTLPHGEEQLRDELISISSDLTDRCNIFPFDMIKEREMEKQISKIFVGIESISTSGNVVHPRGETNIIKHIKKENSHVKVYAFGETYKVQIFDDFHIDYTKLSMLEGNKYIDYIITEHGVHERPKKGWNLNCCIDYWKRQREQVIGGNSST